MACGRYHKATKGGILKFFKKVGSGIKKGYNAVKNFVSNGGLDKVANTAHNIYNGVNNVAKAGGFNMEKVQPFLDKTMKTIDTVQTKGNQLFNGQQAS